MTEKQRLRELLLERRAGLDEQALDAAGVALAGRVAAVVHERSARYVAAYLSVGGEPPTWELLDALRADGVTVVVPRALPGRRMTWLRYVGRDTLTVGRFGIREPDGDGDPDALAQADVVVVPALAVDRAGFRLGRGGGFYDAALAAHPDPVRVAMVHDHEVVDDVHPEGHDERVDVVVTPTRTLSLPAR
ncbi:MULTISPECIES: 5-formyltetrahydrofolate cyclo-ligase [Mumia]|uniref:5-formyltetrahydrofolate cyclo-ligase n=1 Tax=Mumia xiangluensis TaxID=1678900 RepID=A0ABW1QEN7_9ACTN|nr:MULTISPECIES: 5-formyltetrahydrofolate cyclo-ligase [Mumia]